MQRSFFFLFVLMCLTAALDSAQIERHLRRLENKTETNQIRNIDFIYLINLDQRPEKLAKSLAQLAPYGIVPQRLPAIYGWGLSAETLNDVGLHFEAPMELYQWVSYFPQGGAGSREFEFLRESSYGKTYFSPVISLGAIGCTLSHLSVLQDALDSNYETIWVLEDDIDVKADPHHLAALIDQLDELVGKEGWDVLYTDIDTQDYWLYSEKNDFHTDLRGLRTDLFWRPDIPFPGFAQYAKRTAISPDFLKIGSRMRTHSMIIRKSGIEKILQFEKQRGLFVPIDHELAVIPNIKLFSLRYSLVTSMPSLSDTHNRLLDP